VKYIKSHLIYHNDVLSLSEFQTRKKDITRNTSIFFSFA